MNKKQVLKLGFKKIPHYTVMDSLTYELGRNRILSFGSIGTPNEMLYVGQLNDKGTDYDDLVCLHNYDYDGYMTVSRLKSLIKGITDN